MLEGCFCGSPPLHQSQPSSSLPGPGRGGAAELGSPLHEQDDIAGSYALLIPLGRRQAQVFKDVPRRRHGGYVHLPLPLALAGERGSTIEAEKAYTCMGQLCKTLNTASLLQVYQADLF